VIVQVCASEGFKRESIRSHQVKTSPQSGSAGERWGDRDCPALGPSRPNPHQRLPRVVGGHLENVTFWCVADRGQAEIGADHGKDHATHARQTGAHFAHGPENPLIK